MRPNTRRVYFTPYTSISIFLVSSPSTYPLIFLPRWLVDNMLYPFIRHALRIPVRNRLCSRSVVAAAAAAVSSSAYRFLIISIIIFVIIVEMMNPKPLSSPPPRQTSSTPPRTYSRAFRLCYRYLCKSRRPCRCRLATSAGLAASVVVH